MKEMMTDKKTRKETPTIEGTVQRLQRLQTAAQQVFVKIKEKLVQYNLQFQGTSSPEQVLKSTLKHSAIPQPAPLQEKAKSSRKIIFGIVTVLAFAILLVGAWFAMGNREAFAGKAVSLGVGGLQGNLLLDYDFENVVGNNVPDISGRGNDGTLNGGSIVDGDFILYGVSNYVTISDDNSLDGLSAVTVEAWVYKSEFTGREEPIFSKTQAGGYKLGISSFTAGQHIGEVLFQVHVNDGNGNAYKSVYSKNEDGSPYLLPINEWVHVVGTWQSGGKPKVYINGILRGESDRTATGTITPNPANAFIGAESGGAAAHAGHMFSGRIDQVRIFNTALSEAQISEVMAVRVVEELDEASAQTGGVCANVGAAIVIDGIENICLDVGDSAFQWVRSKESALGHSCPSLGESTVLYSPVLDHGGFAECVSVDGGLEWRLKMTYICENTEQCFPSDGCDLTHGICKGGHGRPCDLYLYCLSGVCVEGYCVGPEEEAVDSDGDGVSDDEDACEGHDDNDDSDSDASPDGCDETPCGNEASLVANSCQCNGGWQNTDDDWSNGCEQSICGNGDVDAGEDCLNCPADIGCGAGKRCVDQGGVGICELVPGCGNGVIDGGEECDDGNQNEGDGCSAACQSELAGDVSGPDGERDNCVDVYDIFIISRNVEDASCNFSFADGDVTGDGCVDGEDVAIIKENLNLPCH